VYARLSRATTRKAAPFALDHRVDAMTIPSLGELALLWSADELATYPNAGDNPAAPRVYSRLWVASAWS
jgi:hypothetical protein